MLNWNAEQRVLVVAAHSDDEALGCGGTIARFVSTGSACAVLFLTDGVGARSQVDASLALDRRKVAARKAVDLLGAEIIGEERFPDNAMDTVPLIEIVRCIEKQVTAFNPTIILTHHHGDLNIDHRLVAEATLTACRPTPSSKVSLVSSFEVLSSTDWRFQSQDCFQPDVFVDISDTWDAKFSALKAYDEEMRATPHARSYDAVDSLSRYRGCTVGYYRAEAFRTYWCKR